MTNDQLEAVCKSVAEQTIGFYAKMCVKYPKRLVIAGISGALTACATEAEIDRQAVLDMINGAFDDIGAE